jgi:hypothetical protein
LKLEYLSNINPGYPEEDLIRLFDFDQKEAKGFQQLLKESILNRKEPLDLSTTDFITPVNCSLTFIISEKDTGIQKNNALNFICELTENSYRKMVDLLQPFVENDSSGFQWLYELDGDTTPTELLFSKNGKW